MKLAFITGNEKKFNDVKDVMKEHGIELEWINEPKPESPDQWDIKQVAIDSAKIVAEQKGKPIVVEDTGLFFDAYNHFPGPHSKFAYHALGLDGLLKLLEGKSRKAEFKVVVAYCEPGQEPKVFEGEDKGTIAEKPDGARDKIMPYRNIFIPSGSKDVLAVKGGKVGHRVQAFEKLAKWLNER